LRATLLFMVLVFLGLLFLLIIQVPQVQERFPSLGALDARIRGWAGFEAPDTATDFRLAKPGTQLAELPESLPESEDCGPPPVNPWVQNAAVSPVEAERYELALRIWEYCKQAGRKGEDPLPTFSPSREIRPENHLNDYQNGKDNRGQGALPVR